MCLAWYSLDVFFTASTIIHLCAISLDRYIALHNPLRFHCRRPNRSLVCNICIAWVVPMAIAGPLFIASLYLDDTDLIRRSQRQDNISLYHDSTVCDSDHSGEINLSQSDIFAQDSANFLSLSDSEMSVQINATWRPLRLSYKGCGPHNTVFVITSVTVTFLLPLIVMSITYILTVFLIIRRQDGQKHPFLRLDSNAYLHVKQESNCINLTNSCRGPEEEEEDQKEEKGEEKKKRKKKKKKRQVRGEWEKAKYQNGLFRAATPRTSLRLKTRPDDGWLHVNTETRLTRCVAAYRLPIPVVVKGKRQSWRQCLCAWPLQLGAGKCWSRTDFQIAIPTDRKIDLLRSLESPEEDSCRNTIVMLLQCHQTSASLPVNSSSSTFSSLYKPTLRDYLLSAGRHSCCTTSNSLIDYSSLPTPSRRSLPLLPVPSSTARQPMSPTCKSKTGSFGSSPLGNRLPGSAYFSAGTTATASCRLDSCHSGHSNLSRGRRHWATVKPMGSCRGPRLSLLLAAGRPDHQNRLPSVTALGDSLAKSRRAVKVLGILFAIFVFSYLPFFFLFLVDFFTQTIPVWLLQLFEWIGYSASMLNLFIYHIFNPTFRHALNRILRGHCRPIRRRLPRFFAHSQRQLSSSQHYTLKPSGLITCCA
ncbi:unnamed protein product [Protopolystoma xenopodis]|uniref:G-protein coupled receptors family 1 profile domain-containing protein n=1 Tax=Protopolystoma xenopodis TaxID=117903 RepID=A0A448WE08_9PLAT|nr:unnamed protein product [Protopolystoma xenopodis]